jgi:tetratricopeptide (TPR) repeat protein
LVALLNHSEEPTISRGLFHIAQAHFFIRDRAGVRNHATTLFALAGKCGFAQQLAQAEMLLAWLMSEEGQIEGSISQMKRAIDAYRATGAGVVSIYYAMLAENHGRIGQSEEGLRLLQEALLAIEETGERGCEAELYRLIGELMLSGSQNVEEAERSLRKAIEVARGQASKSLELRSTTSLARLLRDTNRRDEARTMLADIYGWFTEGFDTTDLKDARALLEHLQ